MSTEAEARQLAEKLGVRITTAVFKGIPSLVLRFPKVAPLPQHEALGAENWDRAVAYLRDYADRPKLVHKVWEDLEIMTNDQRKAFLVELSEIFCCFCGRLYEVHSKKDCRCWDDS